MWAWVFHQELIMISVGWFSNVDLVLDPVLNPILTMKTD
jgi:hypothetical protein